MALPQHTKHEENMGADTDWISLASIYQRGLRHFTFGGILDLPVSECSSVSVECGRKALKEHPFDMTHTSQDKEQ